MNMRGTHIFGKLTNDALPEVVGLALGGLITRELPIDFVFYAAHGDGCSDNTSPTACLHWEMRVR